MKNSDYRKLRFAEIEEEQNKLAEMSRNDIEELYRQATRDIEGKINTWYQRLTSDNGVSMAEARKPLSAAELREFKWDVYDYIKYGQDNALSGQWIEQLENASAKFHISKYDALKIQTQQSIESLFAKQSDVTAEAMKGIYQSGYYRTAFEIQKDLGIGWDISEIEQDKLEKVIAEPWAVDGENFSERIWGNKQRLISDVNKELTRNIIMGADSQKAFKAIAGKLNVSKSSADRLVMTEGAYFGAAAQRDCFEELGVEEYEIIATLDSHTSEICQSMNGKRFAVKEFRAGDTAPPFHPWCRSTVCPCFDDDFGKKAGDGERYRIPEDMSYEEWKEKFVDGGDKEGSTAVDKFGNGGIIRSSGFSDHTSDEHFVEKSGKIDPNDSKAVQAELEKFIAENADSDIEKCLVISKNGDMFTVYGDPYTVNTGLLGETMEGSINIHNHVTGMGKYSFSYEDLMTSAVDGSKLVLGFDEKYIYTMSNIPSELSNMPLELSIDKVYKAYHEAERQVGERMYNGEPILDEDIRHETIRIACEILKINYGRFKK